MKLYDSISNQLVDLDTSNTISIYTCGPTVYDYIHIGNARPLILTDLLIRFLNFQNIKTNYLINVTDIDDKIINKALKDQVNELELANHYYTKFISDFRNLNLSKPQKIMRVSDNMPYFINYIKSLIANKHAYVSKKQNVYFSLAKSKTYGAISHNDISKLIQQNKNDDRDKKTNIDFSLWKSTNYGINWNSPWGEGRVGWHLECAALISRYFKDTIDIHIGGNDLKFPHHENERAIFLAKEHKELSKTWVHNGHLHIKNLKMSKSLNNSVYVKDFIKKYDLNLLKYILYTKKYMQPLDFGDNIIQFANSEMKKIIYLVSKIEDLVFTNKIVLNYQESSIDEQIFKSILAELENNLNTANVLEIIKKMMKNLNIKLKILNLNVNSYNYFLQTLSILGFKLPFNEHSAFIEKIISKTTTNKTFRDLGLGFKTIIKDDKSK